MEEKRFFHIKNLHLGHLAKSFGLREAPGKMSSASQAQAASKAKAGGANGKVAAGGKKGARSEAATGDDDETDSDDDDARDPMDLDLAAASSHPHAGAGAGGGGKKYVPTTETEKRMTAAVRRQGRLTKMGGKLGEQSAPRGGARAPGTAHRAAAAGGGGGEFQVASSTSELESLVRRVPGQGQKRKR